jgi:hypothetical protein
MNIKLIPLAGLILLLTFCKKDEPSNGDYFAFGYASGFCIGNCAHFYLIKDNNLYPDDMDRYLNSILKFKSDALSKDKYNLAKKLVDSFPIYLKYNPNKTFGCPDCLDQGGFHIEIKENEQINRWHIDPDTVNLTIEIRAYVKEIQNTLDQLR